MEKPDFHWDLKLEDGYIVDKFTGRMSIEGLAQATEELLKMVEQTGVKRVLYDASELHTGTANTRKQEAAYARNVQSRMDKMATYTNNPTIKFVANVIYRLSGAYGKARVYTDRDAAVAWLRS